MLHRRTYDTLSDKGTVLYWEVSTGGGLIVVQERPSVFTVWHEGWDEVLTERATYDMKQGDEQYEATSFSESQDFAKSILRATVWA